MANSEDMVMESPSYYACRVHLNGDTAYVAWFTADRDGFLRDDGRLVIARTPEELVSAVQSRGIKLEPAEPADYDFDRIRQWCADPDVARFDCSVFLNAWNFLDDLSGLQTEADTPYLRLSRAGTDCYNKLFWGNNLPAVTPTGERFDPVWSPEELAELSQLFEDGLRVLEAELGGSK
jgi:hypothetical protein